MNKCKEIKQLKAENELLRTQAHQDCHALAAGRAIERAAELLPKEFHGDTLGADINAAIDYAIAATENRGQQA